MTVNNNYFVITKEEFQMKKAGICALLMVLCIIATVLLRKPMENAEVDYTEVQVQVVSSEAKTQTARTKYSTSTQTVYEVIVRYQGKDYELKNAHNAYSYVKGRTVTAYLYNGNLYANIEGVQNATPQGTAYSVALFCSFGMFIITMVMLAKVPPKKKVPPQQ